MHENFLYVSINNGDKEVASVKSLSTLHTFPLFFSNPSAVTKELENPGIDPGASRMRSERSPIWANSPLEEEE